MSKVDINIAEIIKDLNNKHKRKIVYLGSEDIMSDVKRWVHTGSTMLDIVMGGGVPIGRIVEIFGDFSAGKSTLATHFMIEFQKLGGIVALIDTETGFDKKRAQNMGLELNERFLVFEAMTVEEGFKIILDFLNQLPEDNEVPVLIVWDTVSNSTTEASKDGDRFGGGLGAVPRLLREGLRVINKQIPLKNASMVFVNQVQASIGAYVPTVDTNVGGGIKFNASIRLHVKNKGIFKENDNPMGITCGIKVVKNKLAKPQGYCEQMLRYETGFHDNMSLFYFLSKKEVGVIEGGGAGYWKCLKFKPDLPSIRSPNIVTFDKWLTDNQGLLEFLQEQLKEHKDMLWKLS